MVCVHHFTPSNHPDISRVRSLRGAESIKLAYVMIKTKFQKNCMKVFFLIWPQRGKQNRIPDTVFLRTRYLTDTWTKCAYGATKSIPNLVNPLYN